ncbi:MAG: SDR family oxidoreductase [Bacteroidetes bacterium]|nr:MAG: SDR family oxidoreductase [Bacteroidota bacterium]TAG86172.1 MAG: SDR family oxidoreductase [Bacteroidota bacterium]
MNLSLENKNALVGGSTQGIGLAVAQILAEMGAKLTLVARNEDKLKEVITTLATPYQQNHTYIVADYEFPEQLADKTKQFITQNKIDTWDILVNNTGGPAGGSLLDASADMLRNAYTQHLICNQILAQIFVPLMKKKGQGRIVNIISTSVKEPLENLGVSNTTRWAVASWAKTLATELASFNITVNNILPGATQTARIDFILNSKSKKENISVEEAKKEMEKTIPMKRFAEPKEIANGVAFFVSDLASYITGTSLAIDGGRTKSM